MKTFITVAVCFLASVVAQQADGTCGQDNFKLSGAPDFQSMKCSCIDSLRKQIQKEMDASITYLSMGAHFSRDIVNRPGFANFFFNSASEEREHSMKLIDYLLMRGEPSQDLTSLITVPTPGSFNSTNGMSALTSALKLETEVTESIRGVIKTCEDEKNGMNHYHLVDYLTGEFLEEQYKGQRELAEKITTLKRMNAEKGTLGEFLFDKTLL